SVSIYTFNGSSWTSSSILNQSIVMLDSGLYQITGEILHTSLYAPMVRDTLPPLTAFSVAGSSIELEGRLFTVQGSSGVLTAQDRAPRGGTPSGVASTLYALDGALPLSYGGPFALPGGAHALAFHSVDKVGNTEPTEGAVVYVDTVPPAFAFASDESTFSLTSGVLGFGVIAPTVTVTLSALDPLVAGAEAGLASFYYVVDGSSAAPAFAAGADSAAASVLLQAGAHTILLTAADRTGNATQESLFVAVGDTVPPVTGVAFGAPNAALPDGSTLVAAATKLTLNATDYAQAGVPPAGVARTEYGFAPDALAAYTTSFTVPAPDGLKTLYYRSTDRAGNVEAVKTAAVVLDTTPPSVAFSFPRPDEGGLCRLVQGRLDVRGYVSDLHLASWGVSAGAVLVGSGTTDASGTLGLFDGTGLSGPVTLSLTSQDLVQNAASTSLQLQTGQPARVLALGGSGLLNKPRGVATGPNRVYVSDTNDGVVRVFDSGGNLLATFGDGKGKGALRLIQPEGLAVDGSGNIYVADAGNKRVVEVSASGTQLAEFGAKHDLKRPMAVALVGGKVIVADAQAGELVAFDASAAVASRTEL
ncbi:MAG: NHL repeat-containing protein, partial [Elusimicrobia bacterium]|nr:NHL repeat-containing protein [Elusimicrobiota bacterium]